MCRLYWIVWISTYWLPQTPLRCGVRWFIFIITITIIIIPTIVSIVTTNTLIITITTFIISTRLQEVWLNNLVIWITIPPWVCICVQVWHLPKLRRLLPSQNSSGQTVIGGAITGQWAPYVISSAVTSLPVSLSPNATLMSHHRPRSHPTRNHMDCVLILLSPSRAACFFSSLF